MDRMARASGGAALLLAGGGALCGCGGDAGLTAPGGTAAPTLALESPEAGAVVFIGEELELQFTVDDPDGPEDAVAVAWVSSVAGVLAPPTPGASARRTARVPVPPQLGLHELVGVVQDGEGGASRTATVVLVVDPDRDGDGHRAVAHGGDDCQDQEATIHPGAPERCDGIDQDCDGEADEDLAWQTWYADADADGAGWWDDTIEACVQPAGYVANDDDCHDDDPARSHCADCWDLRDSYWDVGDGIYTIDPVGGQPFDVACDMTTGEGGWTLVAVNAREALDWTPLAITDPYPFGTVSLTASHKSEAFSTVAMNELRFVSGAEHAVYEPGEGTAHASLWGFLASVPWNNCGSVTGVSWPMVEGNLSDPELCDTDLYVHARDLDGVAACSATLHSWSSSATGPGWSMVGNDSCPHDDSASRAFIDSVGLTPFGDAAPLQMWVRWSGP